MKYRIPILLFILAIIVSCGGLDRDPDLADLVEEEHEVIKEYLEQNITTTVTEHEVYSRKDLYIESLYIFNNTVPTAETRTDSSWVLIDYDFKLLNGTNMDSTDPDIELENYGTYPLRIPIYSRLDTGHFHYQTHVLSYIAKGTSGEVIIPSILLDKSGNPSLRKYTLHNVFEDISEYETELIDKFIERNNYQQEPEKIEQNDSVAFAFINKIGDGELIANRDTVSYRILGMVIIETGIAGNRYSAFINDYYEDEDEDEEEKKEKEDEKFVMSNNPSRNYVASPVFTFMKSMREGDTADIIVSYKLGYGANGLTNSSKQYLINPYSTLLYQVEITRVRKPNTTEPEPDEENE